MIYFTSDLHLYHTNILQYQLESRVAANGDMDTMHQLIVDGINDRVRPNDTLYILGDVTFSSNADKVLAVLGQIKCTDVHLIYGNHDHIIKKNVRMREFFKSVRDYAMISHNKDRFVLMHFPIESWDRKSHGAYHLHGHWHSTNDGSNGYRLLKNRMDVGIDSRTDFSPWSIEECIEFMNGERYASITT